MSGETPGAAAPTPRLAIGPANYAGQATAWAWAARHTLGVDAWSFSRTNSFGFDVGRRLPPRGPVLQRRVPVSTPEVSAVLDGATHAALDGFLALSGGQVAGQLGRDLVEVRSAGVEVALVAHGSDLRDPISHMRRLRHSWFRSAGPAYLASSIAAAARNRLVLARHDGPLFVSTTDLLHEVPHATWLPLTVDPAAWVRTEPAFAGSGPPRVVHVPSRRRPAIKGTDTILPVLRRLAAEGLVELVVPEPGPMSHHTLATLIRGADVVIDQILCDAYGTIAVEAMAAGAVVVASVLGGRRFLPEDPPILDATPRTFETVMRGIVADRDAAAERAAAGPGYVSRWHDGRRAAAALAPWLGVQAPAF